MPATLEGSTASSVDSVLAAYRELIVRRLIDDLPRSSLRYLYDLVPVYPSRPGKALRPALCLATCAAFGGSSSKALNSAVAIELIHNAFLIYDDIQDGSERRRSGPTLQSSYGPGVALNVGNMTNLLALQSLMRNRWLVGASLAWRILEETELMMRHSLEGQAIELRWIRDNVCDLGNDDYYRMCLKKTSWYTCIYPCRLGALIATEGEAEVSRFDRYGWYLGAAFQIQDDILNLTGDYALYGKEIAGDLWEGKRTLMIIDLLRRAGGEERRRLERFLGRSRKERDPSEVAWLRERLIESGSVERARAYAAELSGAAAEEGRALFGDLPESDDRAFLLALPSYVLERDR